MKYLKEQWVQAVRGGTKGSMLDSRRVNPKGSAVCQKESLLNIAYSKAILSLIV